jgi:trehalose 6-phosphate phosphatase
VIELFSDAGRREVARLAACRALYAFDFDGTLAPIVADPAAARAPAEIARDLAQLARQVPVAVISGRIRSDLVERLPGEIAYLVGNHGNEGIDDSKVGAHRAVCSLWRAVLERELSSAAAEGIRIEDKGVSLSLHYRAAADANAALALLRRVVDRLQPAPQVIDGKLVLNLLAPGSITKYEALAALVERTRAEAVLFVGDDDTDELVFERAPPHWTTVRVEPVDSSRARYSLAEQSDVSALLAELVRATAQTGPDPYS